MLDYCHVSICLLIFTVVEFYLLFTLLVLVIIYICCCLMVVAVHIFYTRMTLVQKMLIENVLIIYSVYLSEKK